MNEITTITVDKTLTLHITAIAPSDRPQNRREREKEAVSRLLEHAVGVGSTIGHKDDGAPYIALADGSADSGRHISVSHSSTHALLAISDRPVGADIDHERPTLLRVASRFLSPEEFAAFGDDIALLLKAWTAKEAVFKASALHPSDFAAQIALSRDLDHATVTVGNKSEEHIVMHLEASLSQTIAIAHTV
jgi:phosphopantetheinyl transferase